MKFFGQSMEEQWKLISEISGYESFTNYEMDRNGILRRITDCCRAKKGHMLSWRRTRDGYMSCVIYSSGHCKHLLQHRAIATLFIPNINNHPHVDHVNGIRDDNHIDNLRWASIAENRHNSVKHHSKNGLKHIHPSTTTNKYGSTFYYWIIDIVINGKHIR